MRQVLTAIAMLLYLFGHAQHPIACQNSIHGPGHRIYVINHIVLDSTPFPLPEGITEVRSDTLKDADATAIYGSRAADGAIVITIKHNKKGVLIPFPGSGICSFGRANMGAEWNARFAREWRQWDSIYNSPKNTK